MSKDDSMKLKAVNAMLRVIRQAPETSLDVASPYVQQAVEILEHEDRTVQEHGWWFNTDFNKLLPINNEGNIEVPNTTLKIHSSVSKMRFVQRNGLLYDPINNTEKFTSPVYVDIITHIDFEYIPEVASSYIIRRAMTEFYSSHDSVLGKIQYYREREEEARLRLTSESSLNRAQNVYNSPFVRTFRNRQPRTIGMHWGTNLPKELL